ncbi:hypothetical protein [Candidatus Nanohalococcus occultus]
MSHGHDDSAGCKYGHMFEVHEQGGEFQQEVQEKIQKGEISSLEELENEEGMGPLFNQIMGEHFKKLKVSAGGQGTPYMVSWTCADSFDEDLNYSVHKTNEDIFVAPQSNLHQEFAQRKQQAEQRVNQTLSGFSDLKQQKHLLEHDIRKLRSRVEALNTHDDIQLKADFVELVDGAGGGAQQGSDEAPLKTLRDQNLYPSIVADFYEMDGLDDLRKKENLEDAEKDGKLAKLPANEKAILKKKFVMYEKWKDLYGSEIQRKLKDLKAQLKNIERSIDETKNNLEPYVRDLAMINPNASHLLKGGMDFYPAIQGTASMRRDIEFICYKPLKKSEYDIEVIEDEDEATHFRVVVIHSVHVNLASGEQPNSPAGGPSSATVMYYPAVVCKHVFKNIIEPRIEKEKNRFQHMMDDYVGDFDPGDGLRFRQARENKNWSVRKLRREIGKEVHGEEKQIPLEFSSYIRRIEDGMDEPEILTKGDEFEKGKEYYEAWTDLLDIEVDEEDEKGPSASALDEYFDKLTGKYWENPYVAPPDVNPMKDLESEIQFSYYYGYKIGLGLNTMK